MKNTIDKSKALKCAAVAAIFLGALSLSPWTTVSQGNVKVGSLFGKVQSEVYTEGFHFPVNPMLSFDSFETKESELRLDDISIPSQDKFKSQADVTVMWEFDGAVAATTRSMVGTMADLERKVLVAPLLSILREAGRDVPKAQDLFRADIQSKVQEYVMTELGEYTKPYGITIKAVFIKDITLPRVITSAIVKTKQLEEQEAQEQANLNKQKLVMQRGVEQARADSESAIAKAKATVEKAKAQADSSRLLADAVLYGKRAEAKGNKLLADSVDKDLLKLKQFEVDMQNAKSWTGGCTSNCTSMGDSAVTPLYHMTKGK